MDDGSQDEAFAAQAMKEAREWVAKAESLEGNEHLKLGMLSLAYHKAEVAMMSIDTWRLMIMNEADRLRAQASHARES